MVFNLKPSLNKENTNVSEILSAGEKQLAEGKILPLFFRFAVPGVLGFIFLGLQVLVDGVMLGRFVGANALASVTIVYPAYGLMIASSIVINVGCQCQLGIKLGERKFKEANNIFFSAFILMLLMIIIWTLPNFLFSEKIAYLLGANDILIKDASDYLRILSLSSIASLVYFCNGSLRAQGRPYYAFIAMTSMVISNAVLDYIFICEFSWGVKGAAFATILSGVIGLAIALPPFLLRSSKISLWQGSFVKNFALRVLYNGSPDGLSEFSIHIATFLFNISLMKYIGEQGVAAFAAIAYLAFLVFAFFIGLADASRSIISFNYGQKSYDRVLSVLTLAAKCMSFISLAFLLLFLLYSEPIIGVFFSASDSKVLKMAAWGTFIYAFNFPFQAMNLLVSSYFTGIGKPKVSMCISILKGLVFVAIGLYFLPKFFGETGIWLTVPFAEFLCLWLSGFLIWRAVKSLGVNKHKKLKS